MTDLLFDKSNSVKFTTIVKELESAGIMTSSKSFPFEFNVEKAYETYSGINVRLRYFVRVTISRNYNSNIVKETDIIVRNITPLPVVEVSETPQPGIKMEVGIEECLHIEFEFDKQKYHLKVRCASFTIYLSFFFKVFYLY
jgi:vacuolar protein sorting-associated protein 26